MINIKEKKHERGISIFEIQAKKYELCLTNVGASIFDLKTFDKNQNLESIVLKLDSFNELLKNKAYFGSSVGRNSGRIKDGKFTIADKTYQLPINDNGNNCHSSGKGISHRIMSSKVMDKSIQFDIDLLSQNDGFPGDIHIKITYLLSEDGFKIKYEAISTEDTICNITNHTYFNLSGNLKRDVISHSLDFNDLESYWELDDTNIPLAKKKCNFNSLKEFKDEYANKPQRGMDHPFETKANKICLEDKESGRTLNVSSSYNSVVLYTQNWELPIVDNKVNQGIAIEFQHLPNDININQDNSKTLLKKGQVYSEWTKYSFN